MSIDYRVRTLEHKLACLSGKLNNLTTEILNPLTLNNNTLTVSLTDRDGVKQNQSIDLNKMVSDSSTQNSDFNLQLYYNIKKL